MNGRCETDPLDLAVDVCDRCYGEFCENHLVRPKGRRHPFCSDCALAASGVRGSSKLNLRGSRRTAKKRRADLKAQSGEAEQVFTFFELEEPEEADENAVVAEAETDTATFDEPIEAEGEGDAASPSEDELPPTPAVAKLEKLRRGTGPDAGDKEQLDPAAPQESSAASATPATKEPAGAETPKAPSPPPKRPPRASTPAKKPAPATAPMVEPPVVAAKGPEQDQQRAPQKAAASSRPTDTEPVSIDQASTRSTENSVKQQPEDRAPGALPLPSRHSRLPGDQQEAPRETEASAAEEVGSDEPADAPPPRPTHRRPTAPMIGEIKNVAGRRSEDAPVPLEPAQTSVAVSSSPVGDTRNAIEEFDATRPVDDVEENPSGRADTDGNGNWIPPILRGFAPDAAEAKADLPKRRTTD